jgi:excisionase family DNA binding protein
MARNSCPDIQASPLCHTGVSVKDAAMKLGVSRSTVYRMNRAHGPLRFVRRGRRVFIDVLEFNRYIQSQEHSHKLYRTSDQEPQRSISGGSSAKATELLHAPDNKTVRNGSGQRELVIPERLGPSVVLFLAW